MAAKTTVTTEQIRQVALKEHTAALMILMLRSDTGSLNVDD
jgi:hypothetical protein